MKKILSILCLSFFIVVESIATEGSSHNNATKDSNVVNNSPYLYNFSDKLLKSAKSCTPYTENFTELNPKLGDKNTLLGGKLTVLINIKGEQENKCVFDVEMKLGALGRQIYHCKINDTQQSTLYKAMLDRSNDIITETFDSYVITKNEDGDIIDKKTYKTTMTDNRFNIEWSKIVEECDIEQKTLAKEEEAGLEKQFNTFEDGVLSSLHNCEKTSTYREVLFFRENIEVKGWDNGKCILEYDDFTLLLPQEHLKNIQAWDDIHKIIKNKEIAKYHYEKKYIHDYILYAVGFCSRTDGTTNGISMTTNGIKVKSYIKYKKTPTGCDVAFVNLLNRGEGEEDYTKICKLPKSYVQDINDKYSDLIRSYLRKSNISSTTKDQIETINEKIWQEINENQFCN